MSAEWKNVSAIVMGVKGIQSFLIVKICMKINVKYVPSVVQKKSKDSISVEKKRK